MALTNGVQFKQGTFSQYEASSKNAQTFYYITDKKDLYLGDVLLSATDSGAVTVEKDESASGVAARYIIKQNGVALPTTIDIPKDLVVKSGQVVKDPLGQEAGTYIELTLSNADADKIYVNVGTLVDLYTSGDDTSSIAVTVDNALRKITAKVVEGGITATELATDAVETAKIKDANVTTDKLAEDAVTATKIADSAVETNAIANNAITENKLAEAVSTKINDAVSAVTWGTI